MGAPSAAHGAQVAQLRSLVQDCIAKHLHATAVFFADKLVSLTDYGAGDVFLLAQVQLGGRAGATARAVRGAGAPGWRRPLFPS
jgi:hypothetical protein